MSENNLIGTNIIYGQAVSGSCSGCGLREYARFIPYLPDSPVTSETCCGGAAYEWL